MSTPQDPPRRLKQKRRRQTQLAAWRVKRDAQKAAGETSKAPVAVKPAS
jgi:hypothetical protein